MFGNPYSPYHFTGPQMGQNAPFMPTCMSTPQQPLTPPTSGPAFLQVATAKEFDSVTIQPGRQALIMAQNDPYIAFKSADNMGMVTTTLYRLEPVTDCLRRVVTEMYHLCGCEKEREIVRGLKDRLP